MPTARRYERRAGPRDLLFFTRPALWPRRPFLPVLRLPAGEPPEYGVLYDAVGASGRYGLSATVFLTCLFALPPTEAEFLALPHRSYDTPEELAGDGWVVD
jgi:hypothetical protein